MNNLKSCLFLILFLLFAFGCSRADEFRKICVKDTCLKAEVVRSDRDKEKGLMFRKRLAQDEGMLFIFDEERQHSFWMKNTLIPLDIIWISADKKIVDIHKDASLCKNTDTCQGMAPRSPALFVLEVNSGFCRKHNLEVGDTLEF